MLKYEEKNQRNEGQGSKKRKKERESARVKRVII